MKIQKTELANKLNKIKSVVSKKAQNEVLQGILVKDGYLIASNLELTIKAKIEGIEGESFIIPERAFELINNLPDGEVEIAVTSKDTITIKAATIKNKYKTMEPLQFPETTVYKDENRLTIKANVLTESMRRVSYAIPVQGSKTIMTCMCLQASGGYLNFVGLDGHVLAWDRVNYDGEFELLIPKNTIEKLKSLGLSGDVQISHSRTGAVFITEDFEIYTRLVEGEYFKYQAMFRDLPIHTNAKVYGNAKVFDNAKVCNNAEVYGNAKVYNDTWVYGNVCVCNNAEVYGNAKVYGNVDIYSNAKVCGDAQILYENHLLVIGPIGSRNSFTTFFRDKDNEIAVKCGCFCGKIDKFIERVQKTHGDGRYAAVYRAAVEVAKIHINLDCYLA